MERRKSLRTTSWAKKRMWPCLRLYSYIKGKPYVDRNLDKLKKMLEVQTLILTALYRIQICKKEESTEL